MQHAKAQAGLTRGAEISEKFYAELLKTLEEHSCTKKGDEALHDEIRRLKDRIAGNEATAKLFRANIEQLQEENSSLTRTAHERLVEIEKIEKDRVYWKKLASRDGAVRENDKIRAERDEARTMLRAAEAKIAELEHRAHSNDDREGGAKESHSNSPYVPVSPSLARAVFNEEELLNGPVYESSSPLDEEALLGGAEETPLLNSSLDHEAAMEVEGEEEEELIELEDESDMVVTNSAEEKPQEEAPSGSKIIKVAKVVADVLSLTMPQ